MFKNPIYHLALFAALLSFGATSVAETVDESSSAIANTAIADPSLLIGDTWEIDDVTGGGVAGDARASLSFLVNGRLLGTGSCNSMVGSYGLTGRQSPRGGDLTVLPLGTTSTACSTSSKSLERRLFELLGRIERFDIDDTGALLLSTSDGNKITARRR